MQDSRVLILVALLGLALPLTVFSAEWGEKCDDNNRCNVEKNHRCLNDICKCENSNYVLNQAGYCVGKFNQTCKTAVSDGSPPIFCVDNAECLKTKDGSTCFCRPKYAADEDGFCKAIFGGECSVNEHCKASSLLDCDTTASKCVCDQLDDTQYWDNVKKTCISLIEGTCEDRGTFPRPCTESSDCVEGTCQCKAPKVATEDKRWCVSGYDGACNNDDECVAGLKCLVVPPTSHWSINAKTCRCPEDQIYENNKCIVKVGGECDQTLECVLHAKCDPSSGATPTCQCEDHFVGTKNGKCAGGFGANCTEDPNICSTAEHRFTCSEGVCSCKDMELDAVAKSCVKFFGSDCTDDSECHSVSSTCAGAPTGKCQCKDKFIATPETEEPSRQCLADHDTDCSQVGCNSFGFLQCASDNVCKCEDTENQFYVGDNLHSCVAKVSAKCGPEEAVKRNLTCPINAQCTKVEEETENTCKCKENSRPSDDLQKCGLEYGQTCDGDVCADGFICNVDSDTTLATFNEIFATGSCGCAANQKYNDREDLCQNIAGADCTGTDICVDYAACNDTTSGKCICEEGYTAIDGSCAGKFGANCTGNAQACASSLFLVCDNNACACGNTYDYNDAQGRCVGYADSKCNGNDDCQAHSGCQNTQCKCSTGYLAESSGNKRKCLGLYDSACTDAKNDCHTDRFFKCTGNKCACEDPEKQEPSEDDQCVAQAEQPCGPKENRDLLCIANATCPTNTENPTCQCLSGYHVEDKHCKENSAPKLMSGIWMILLVSISTAAIKSNLQV